MNMYNREQNTTDSWNTYVSVVEAEMRTREVTQEHYSPWGHQNVLN